jgi:hypothetical protein
MRHNGNLGILGILPSVICPQNKELIDVVPEN